MKFKLPKQFECGGQTIKVYEAPGLSKGGAHGLTKYDECEVWFDADLKPEDLKGITFYHEIMHIVFATLGKDALRDDEGLVDSCGNLLWQIHKSMKF